MVVALSSYELVNVAYYVLLPWDMISSSNTVAVAAATSLLGPFAGIAVTILVALSCAGSINTNMFTVGRLTVAATQRHYLPSFLGRRGLPKVHRKHDSASEPLLSRNISEPEDESMDSGYDAPMYVLLPRHIYLLPYLCNRLISVADTQIS
jgi:L-type amino acid transporter 9